MTHRVLVLAQGDGRRWDRGGRPYLGVPKHLVNVEGETPLGRAARLFAALADEVIVVGPADRRYDVDGARLVTLDDPHPTGTSMDKLLATRPLWGPQRTTIVWGDCYYTQAAAEKIAGHDTAGIHYFRRTGPSAVTGHPHDESFAVTWTADAAAQVVAAAERVVGEVRARRIRSDHIFHHYAAVLGHDDLRPVKAVADTPGQTVIDDWTDDFDKPSEYREWMRRRGTVLPVSVAVMAHPRRREWAEQLAARLDAPVVWDESGGTWDTCRRALELADTTASHHLVVQDDAIICRDLLAGVGRAVAVAGNVPVSLYVGHRQRRSNTTIDRYERAIAHGRPFLVAPGPKWGLAVAHPVALLEETIRRADAQPVRADDARLKKAYRDLGVPCWYTAPSLVDHRDGPSIVRGSDGGTGRRAHRFAGEDASAAAIDWTGEPLITGVTSAAAHAADAGHRTVTNTSSHPVERAGMWFLPGETVVVDPKAHPRRWREVQACQALQIA